MADIFDELLLPTGEPPAPELINALRRQRKVGQIGALSGDKNIQRVGAHAFDDSLAQATDLRDRRDQETQRAENRAFQKWQQEQAMLDRRQARADKKDYQDRALAQAREIADARNAKTRPVQSEFQKNYDRKAGQEALAWDTSGQTMAEASLRDISGAISKLSDPKNKDVGGSVLTLIPGGDNIRRLTDPVGTEIQRLSNRVTVQNLRDTFGPQFTQVEGEKFQALDYDPALSNEQNLANLREKEAIIKSHIAKKNALFNSYRDQVEASAAGSGGEPDIDGFTDDQLADWLINQTLEGAQ